MLAVHGEPVQHHQHFCVSLTPLIVSALAARHLYQVAVRDPRVSVPEQLE
jgi:hypothetical protein